MIIEIVEQEVARVGIKGTVMVKGNNASCHTMALVRDAKMLHEVIMTEFVGSTNQERRRYRNSAESVPSRSMLV